MAATRRRKLGLDGTLKLAARVGSGVLLLEGGSALLLQALTAGYADLPDKQLNSQLMGRKWILRMSGGVRRGVPRTWFLCRGLKWKKERQSWTGDG